MLFKTLRASLLALVWQGLMIMAPTQPAPTTVNFSSQTYNTGPNPTGVVSGDFNEDGKPDLAVIDGQSSSVQVLVNVGGGLFTLGSQTNTGTGPLQIVTGAFDLSGHQDLAVANAGDRTMTILLGNGNGTFATESFSLSGAPRAMVGVNLLNDGLTQLAVVECKGPSGPCSLNIYQSDAHALFSRSQSIPLPAAPLSDGLIVTDDFSHRHKNDIAVATDKQVLIFVDSSAFNGTGMATVALQSVITPPNTASIIGLAAGHFVQNNATPDLAIEVFDNVNETNFPNSDYIFLNNGFGSFFLKGKVPGTGGFGHSLAVADLNGDGIQDLILLGTAFHNGDLSYALGHGDGTFRTPQQVSAFPGGINTAVIARDLSLNSRHDLVVASNGVLGGPAFTDVLLNQNAKTNCAPPASSTLSVNLCSATTARNSISVSASANSPNGVKRVELWVDGVKRAQAFDDQLHVTIGASHGTHHVTVVGVDLYDALTKHIVTVTVP